MLRRPDNPRFCWGSPNFMMSSSFHRAGLPYPPRKKGLCLTLDMFLDKKYPTLPRIAKG